MTDTKIDQVFERVARAPHQVERAVLDRISTTLCSSLRPVRPLPANGLLIMGVLFVCGAIAFGGAARSGFFGFHALGIAARVIVLSTLGILAWVAARECVGYWIPGSRHNVTPWGFVALSCAALLSVFALLFHDYGTEHFFSAGVICLSAGVTHAIPAACIVAWLLRRGLLTEVVSGGAIAGALGGLTGVMMLELHCAKLEAPHILLWHVAVVPVSAAAGALVGWGASRFNFFARR